MRAIKQSSAFKKDFRRVKANPRYTKIVDERLKTALEVLCNDQPLPKSFRDHDLIGNWRNFRECHLTPDLLLIYCQTSDGLKLQLARIGSHGELFG